MINVAVIGTGYIGPLHIEALRRMGGVRVKGICDVDQERAKRVAAKYDIQKLNSDWTEAIADSSIQVVHTCSPNRLHYSMNKAALEAGKHVLSEKPLAMTYAEAEELTLLAEQKGLITGTNFCYRYYPAVLDMASRVRRAEAGDIRMVTGTWFQDWLSRPADWSWRLERQEAGESNTAADLGSHWFDLVQFVTDLRVVAVMADFATLVPIRQKPTRPVLAFENVTDEHPQSVQVELEDYAAVLFRLSNGAPGSFTTCQATVGRKSDTEIQVYGSRCSLAWDHRSPNRVWIGHREKPNETVIDGALPDPATAAYTPLPTGHPLGYQDAILNLFKDFYEAVRVNGENPEHPHARPTFRSGMEAMQILEAVVLSAKEHKWVNV